MIINELYIRYIYIYLIHGKYSCNLRFHEVFVKLHSSGSQEDGIN